MILNELNYYSNEANKEYMSYSQFKDFIKCPAYAMAKIKENIEIGINEIKRYRFECGKWKKIFYMKREGEIIKEIKKKLK